MSALQLLLIAIFLPLLAAPLPALLARRFSKGLGYLVMVVPILSTICIVAAAMQAGIGVPTPLGVPWFPAVGINLHFLLDGLSLFFALVVSGMGIMIVFYAKHYMEGHYEFVGRFYSYILLFMAAMLGTVLADNLMLLFIFWELTGISSFLLIGFSHEKKEGRYGARMALLVTVFTGLFMLVGIIMLGIATGGVLDVSKLGEQGFGGVNTDWIQAAMVLMLMGAFGKSAQFPLHFWLPNAMAAPTPVSAYLHSATMVKLGVFLCARLFPLFSEYDLWGPLLMTIGTITMVLGAVLAVYSHDLKAILAFATVSQLGAFISYYGMGAGHGVVYDYLNILTHVLYKGALFMMAGIIDHAAHTRDIRNLGGLFKRMPVMGVAFAICVASMIGLPPTIGFLSKEVMLNESIHALKQFGSVAWWLVAASIVTTLCKCIFGARLFFHAFWRAETPEVKAHFHWPGWAVQIPALVLAAASLLLGVVPAIPTAIDAALAVPGLQATDLEPLKLWHGVNAKLLITIAMFTVGFGIFAALNRTNWKWAVIPHWLRFDLAFEAGITGLGKFAIWITRLLRHEKPLAWMPIVVLFAALAIGALVIGRFPMDYWNSFIGHAFSTESVNPLRVATGVLIAIALIGVLVLKHWSGQLVALSVSGFLTTFYYVLYAAPDLAMTQLLVETATLILVLLVLNRFHHKAQLASEPKVAPVGSRVIAGVIAGVFGLLVTMLILIFSHDPHPQLMGGRFLELTKPLAHGLNAVNTILVDFRGFDTLGEIVVLVIATLGCMGLLMRRPLKKVAPTNRVTDPEEAA